MIAKFVVFTKEEIEKLAGGGMISDTDTVTNTVTIYTNDESLTEMQLTMTEKEITDDVFNRNC